MEKVKSANFLKKIASIILCATVLFSFSTIYATNVNSTTSAETFSYQKINEISENDNDSTWTPETKISEKIPLYDADELLNGYIFNLVNGTSPCGYIQIAIIQNNYSIIGYSFYEKHYISDEISQLSDDEGFNKNKIIFTGNFDYLLKSNPIPKSKSRSKNVTDEKYLNILINKETTDKTAVNKQSDAYTNSVKEGMQSRKPLTRANTMTSNKVINYSTSDYSIQKDFNGKTFTLSNGKKYTVTGGSPICAPNAGVNLIKYWGQRRGISNLWYSSDWWVFSSLMQTMDFRSGTLGVTGESALKGMKNYCTSIRGVTYDGSNFEKNFSFARAKALIDDDIPFMVGTYNSQQYGTGGHAITCYGYNQANSASKQLIINDGFSRSLSYRTVSSLVELKSLSYIRWN